MLLHIDSPATRVKKKPMADYKNADWGSYRNYINNNLVRIPTEITLNNIDEAATTAQAILVEASLRAIPQKTTREFPALPKHIMTKSKKRRRLRRIFYRSGNQTVKTNINQITKEIKSLIIQLYKDAPPINSKSSPPQRTLQNYGKSLRRLPASTISKVPTE